MPAARSLLRFGLVLLFAGRAAAFSYDEGVSGDLENDASDNPPIFAFELGVNSVSGSTRFSSSEGLDGDYFTFTLPTGAQLESVLLTYELTSVGGDLFYLQVISQINIFGDDGGWRGHENAIGAAMATIYSTGAPYAPVDTSPVALSFLDVVDSSTVPGTSTLPLAGGPYVFVPGLSANTLGDPNATWDYTYSFSVVPIPEPGTGVLLGAGLVGLGLRRRARMS